MQATQHQQVSSKDGRRMTTREEGAKERVGGRPLNLARFIPNIAMPLYSRVLAYLLTVFYLVLSVGPMQPNESRVEPRDGLDPGFGARGREGGLRKVEGGEAERRRGGEVERKTGPGRGRGQESVKIRNGLCHFNNGH
jgi:hypothetical protein